MTALQIISTFLGAALLPFFVILLWGRLTEKWQVRGGLLAAFLIIGPIWLINHGLPQALLVQSSQVFVDMGITTAVGVFVYGVLKGGNVRLSVINILAALVGGCLAGLLLYLFKL